MAYTCTCTSRRNSSCFSFSDWLPVQKMNLLFSSHNHFDFLWVCTCACTCTYTMYTCSLKLLTYIHVHVQ